MSISIYKPQKNSGGCAASFFVSQHDCLMVNLIQQHSWNEAKKTGSFSENKGNPEKTASLKLNEFECGEIIYAIESYSEWKGYHSFGDSKTRISFTTWQKGDTKMFGFSVDQNGKAFKLPITMGEAICLKILMQSFIEKSVNAKKENPS